MDRTSQPSVARYLSVFSFAQQAVVCRRRVPLLALLSITLYILAWPENPAPVVVNATTPAPVVTSALAGPTGNTLHFLGGVAASFFLPLGYPGMALLGLRRAPGLATLAAALSLVGWIPWSALIALGDLAYQIAQAGTSPELAALWLRFNGDAVMVAYLLIYVVGHLLGAVLIGLLLARLGLVPGWAAWAFALTSPLTMAYFAVHTIEVRYVLRYLICGLWIIGAIPAALAMVKGDDLVEPTPRPARGSRATAWGAGAESGSLETSAALWAE